MNGAINLVLFISQSPFLRDANIDQTIEEKVVNRLRQVTSAIERDQADQVNIITSTAEREAAVAFGQANAMRPKIVGEALKQISADPAVLPRSLMCWKWKSC